MKCHEAISQGFKHFGGEAQRRSNTLTFSLSAIDIFLLKTFFVLLGRQMFSVNDTELESGRNQRIGKNKDSKGESTMIDRLREIKTGLNLISMGLLNCTILIRIWP